MLYKAFSIDRSLGWSATIHDGAQTKNIATPTRLAQTIQDGSRYIYVGINVLDEFERLAQSEPIFRHITPEIVDLAQVQRALYPQKASPGHLKKWHAVGDAHGETGARLVWAIAMNVVVTGYIKTGTEAKKLSVFGVRRLELPRVNTVARYMGEQLFYEQLF